MRPEFHPLTIAAIEELTDDSVAITFEVPEELRAAYAFRAGQHLTIRTVAAGDDVRRSYSICSPEGANRLRIGVKRLPGGAFSETALSQLGVGDPVEVMTPMGHFGAALEGAKRPAFVAAGSGITPVLSMAATALERDDVTEVLVLTCDRTQASMMFLEEVADLKDRFAARLQVVQVLTREPQDSELLSARLDAERLSQILDLLVPDERDGWFLCGPFDLVTMVHEVLLRRDVAAEDVHTELFHAEAPDRVAVAEARGEGAEVLATLDGRQSAFTVPPGGLVLEALLGIRRDAPYACRGGVCGTCRARLVEGSVAMDANWALEPDEVRRGYVLTCQSRPTSERLVLDYDG